MLNTLFTFYLEDRGWLLFLILPVVIFLVMLVDNQRNKRGAVGWLAGVFICLLLFTPAMVYDIGPVETRQALTEVRVLLFYVGILGFILPVMLFIGYWFSYRSAPSHGLQTIQQPIGGVQPVGSMGLGNVGGVGFGADEAQTEMEGNNPKPVGYGGVGNPLPPIQPPLGGGVYQTDDEKPTKIEQVPLGARTAKNSVLLNAWLIDMSNQNNRYQLRAGRTQIGRGSQHDINIMHDTVSRNGHAIIIYENGQFIIRDLGASAGVQVNNYPISGAAELHHNSIITLGEVKFQFISS
jgi:hypothetical protein